MEKDNVKYKVINDYPTVEGMLYKNEIVKLDNGDNKPNKIRVKDLTGKIWFVKSLASWKLFCYMPHKNSPKHISPESRTPCI